jgi:hypothetical protein
LNIKKLAFETKPMNDKEGNKINPENQKKYTPVESLTGEKTWMSEIEERIRLKAGNPSFRKEESEKDFVKTGKLYGSGISESEVEKVMKNFKKQ